jgi:predicted methyltransferase
MVKVRPMAVVRHLRTCTLLLVLSALPGTPIMAAAKEARAIPTVTDAATDSALDRVLDGDQRSAASRERDVYRHPKATLGFFGIRRDMTVLEVWPGKAGWWTEILAPLLKDHGHYVAAQWDPKSEQPFIQDGLKAYQAKLAADPTSYGKVSVVALQYPNALTPVAPNSVDLALTFRNLHNWLGTPDAAKAMLTALYRSLKPGGILGVEDHRAAPSRPTDLQLKLGYVDEQAAIDLVKSVGFEYLGASEVNANPKDTKDYEQGVWTLPPTYRLGDKDRDRYKAIGESDRFTLKFRKPLEAR